MAFEINREPEWEWGGSFYPCDETWTSLDAMGAYLNARNPEKCFSEMYPTESPKKDHRLAEYAFIAVAALAAYPVFSAAYDGLIIAMHNLHQGI